VEARRAKADSRRGDWLGLRPKPRLETRRTRSSRGLAEVRQRRLSVTSAFYGLRGFAPSREPRLGLAGTFGAGKFSQGESAESSCQTSRSGKCLRCYRSTSLQAATIFLSQRSRRGKIGHRAEACFSTCGSTLCDLLPGLSVLCAQRFDSLGCGYRGTIFPD
jgi:hypothetical protein